MATVYAIHGTDPDKLRQVEDEMRALGAPTIEDASALIADERAGRALAAAWRHGPGQPDHEL